ncbi:hypothetical protein F442_08892 [Phytophthora nicotianae P10297]|uniref:Uncharacterized protein n=3 Tax=Phytophthora nicotianae TaxID=4792 RepID=V9F8E0_PHYNI|nr:hypothetical protein F443_08963 [Phytophthora nicotianae P1569]ETP44520.1 hypothetical protein F442_08892 [Phytophthora nicotianae P10297]
MNRQLMSPTLWRTGEDFPRLNGSNFPVWDASILAALDGQGLLGFIDQDDYDDNSDASSDNSDSESPTLPDPKSTQPSSPTSSDTLLSDTGTLHPNYGSDAAADTAAQPKDSDSGSEAHADSSFGNSSETKTSGKTSSSPPVIKSFTETKGKTPSIGPRTGQEGSSQAPSGQQACSS